MDRCFLAGCSGSSLRGGFLDTGDLDLGFFTNGDFLFLTGDLEGFFLLSSLDSERLRLLTAGDLDGPSLRADVFLACSGLFERSLRFFKGDLERPLRSSTGERERSLRFTTGDLERSFRKAAGGDRCFDRGDLLRSFRDLSFEGDRDFFLNALLAAGDSCRFFDFATGLSLLSRFRSSGDSDRLRSRRSFDLPRRFSSSFFLRLSFTLSWLTDRDMLRCFIIFIAGLGCPLVRSRLLLPDLSRRPLLTDRELPRRSSLFDRDLPLRFSSTFALLTDRSRRFGSSRRLFSTSLLFPAEGDLLRRLSSSRFLLGDRDFS